MGEDVTTRRIRDGESDIVASIAVDAFAEYAARMSPDAWSVFAREIASVGQRLSDDEVLVAERDGHVIGFVAFYSRWEGAQADACNIRLLAVPPAERGSGIGQLLLQACIDECREAGKARVVMALNPELTPVKELSERLGFRRHPGLDHMPAPGVHAEGFQLDL